MASKYAKPMQIPSEFPDVLKNFTREVLRLQGRVESKEDIYEFGVKYFKELLLRRDGATAKASLQQNNNNELATPVYVTYSEEEIQSYLCQLFQFPVSADSGSSPDNNTGSSSAAESFMSLDVFKKLLQQVAQDLQFSSREIKALYAEADETDGAMVNAQGAVYSSPMPRELMKEIGLNHAQRLSLQQKPPRNAPVMLHGILQEETESLLREIFQRADIEGTGVLSRSDFVECLRDLDLGFCRRELNLLLMEAPTDEEGRVLYGSFLPQCFPILADVFINHIIEMPNDQEALTQYLTEVFASGDPEQTGFLPTAELGRLLRIADVGLTRLQILAVLSEAQEDNSGLVNFEKFAISVAGMVLMMVSIESQQNSAEYIVKYRQSSQNYAVLDMNQHSFEQTLARAIEALDESHRGLVPRQDVIEGVRNAFPDMTQRQVNCLMAVADKDENGDVDYQLIIHSAFQALQKLQEIVAGKH